ncbi:MAG: Bug family tripartite tricarboxylate transporter substrate binding protein, partial [Wohlfahrtiimonas sp.]
MEKNIHYKIIGLITIFISSLLSVSFGEVRQPECVVPAKAGGGFERTCKLIQHSFKDSGVVMRPLRIVYMPGNIGGVAYDHMVNYDNNNANTIVTFSTGTLLNIIQGDYGPYDEHSVRWLAGITMGYGALFVKTDSNLRNLADLIKLLKTDPQSITMGMSGRKGGQNWMQMAMFAQLADFDMKKIRVQAMDGGGEMIEKLYDHKINLMSTNIIEMMPYVKSGDIRILAIFADEKAKTVLGEYPTAKEQGYDVVWPVVRGVYMGPNVSDADYDWWVHKFDELLASEEFEQWRLEYHTLPL